MRSSIYSRKEAFIGGRLPSPCPLVHYDLPMTAGVPPASGRPRRHGQQRLLAVASPDRSNRGGAQSSVGYNEVQYAQQGKAAFLVLAQCRRMPACAIAQRGAVSAPYMQVCRCMHTCPISLALGQSLARSIGLRHAGRLGSTENAAH